MMVLKQYYHTFTQVPSVVKLFLGKALLLLIAWKLMYLLLLQPHRILDKPLTYFTAISSVETLNLIAGSKDFTMQAEVDEYEADSKLEKQPVMAIYNRQQKALSIADACNALELLFICRIYNLLPCYCKKKNSFIIGGLFLYVSSIFCAAHL